MIIEILTLLIISFIATFVLTKIAIKKLIRSNLKGVDVHKLKKVDVAESGGLVFSIVIVFCILIYIGFLVYTKNQDTTLIISLLAATTAIIIMAFLGFIDDVLNLKWRHKILLPVFAAVPLIVLEAGTTTMKLPFFGIIDFGLWYLWFLIPIAVIGASNMTNMLAGFNGLETGMGLITGMALFLFALMHGKIEAIIILAPFIGAMAAFLIFNWYPSKIFPGDVGTFTIGVVLITAVIMGSMQKFGILIFTLFILNFFLFLIWRFMYKRKYPYVKFAEVDEDGIIKPKNPFTVYWMLPYFFRLNEKQNVAAILSMQILICALSFLVVGFI